jgi:transposase
MPFRKISRDIKIAAIRLYEDDILSKAAILDYLAFSTRTFDRILALWNATGDVVRNTNGVRGRPRVMHFSDVDYLKRLIQHRPDWFLDELEYLLQNNRFIAAHFTTVHRELVRAGISSKKIKKIALERNEDLRADFIGRMAQYTSEQLGFLDEVSKDERTAFRTQGRSRKGTRASRKGVFVRGRRFSAEGLLSIDGMIANTVVEGSMTRALFLEYLEFTVVSQCQFQVCCIVWNGYVVRFHCAHHFPEI